MERLLLEEKSDRLSDGCSVVSQGQKCAGETSKADGDCRYERLSRRTLMMNGRYAHARQMQRAVREQKRLRTYLVRVIRDIERKLSENISRIPQT
ncbi:hypothetical protein [Nitrosomonas sp. Is37]|uniref:hypothetical protein n=1 Tax=Nitrosomonas sp. Is37 TaxID=3080535 RepID=UPI00294B4647|nr:hypothetical protein [Nitrosomonas sp. Is37]MDV6343979.1 hypothetical protein [Nitrosomonas sp. Is37]